MRTYRGREEGERRRGKWNIPNKGVNTERKVNGMPKV